MSKMKGILYTLHFINIFDHILDIHIFCFLIEVLGFYMYRTMEIARNLLYNNRRAYAMEISLRIIWDRWEIEDIDGTELCIYDRKHTFYKAVRLLTESVRELEDSVCLNFIQYLEQYDEKYHCGYYETLYEYVRNDRSLVKTARNMHIHRNTLVYRLEKVEQLIPLILDDPDFRLCLLLMYEIRKY